jgi:hypothetical protein
VNWKLFHFTIMGNGPIPDDEEGIMDKLEIEKNT